jgi:hypothetical protein
MDIEYQANERARKFVESLGWVPADERATLVWVLAENFKALLQEIKQLRRETDFVS